MSGQGFVSKHEHAQRRLSPGLVPAEDFASEKPHDVSGQLMRRCGQISITAFFWTSRVWAHRKGHAGLRHHAARGTPCSLKAHIRIWFSRWCEQKLDQEANVKVFTLKID